MKSTNMFKSKFSDMMSVSSAICMTKVLIDSQVDTQKKMESDVMKKIVTVVWKGICKAMSEKGLDKNSRDYVNIKEKFSSYIKQKSTKMWTTKEMVRSDSLAGRTNVGSDLNRTSAFHDVVENNVQSTSNANLKQPNSKRFNSDDISCMKKIGADLNRSQKTETVLRKPYEKVQAQVKKKTSNLKRIANFSLALDEMSDQDLNQKTIKDDKNIDFSEIPEPTIKRRHKRYDSLSDTYHLFLKEDKSLMNEAQLSQDINKQQKQFDDEGQSSLENSKATIEEAETDSSKSQKEQNSTQMSQSSGLHSLSMNKYFQNNQEEISSDNR